MRRLRVMGWIACVAISPVGAHAQPDPSGVNFVTVGSPNNPAYFGPDPFGYVTGRGSVGYEYQLGQMEITTGQWLEFVNAALGRATPLPFARAPLDWGATIDPTYSGPGQHYKLKSLPNAAMIPGYTATWRTAAMYCNWLCNGKSSAPAAFLSGAYDVSTFHDNPDGTFTDQVTHSPGAQYWIPTLDEWIKAAHWSPDNPNNAGWYQYSNASDIPLTYGPPPAFGGDGTGQANAGFQLANFAQFDIPLGSYPQAPSLRGLLDIAGCAGEWTEGIRIVNGRMFRTYLGSYAGGVGDDSIYGFSDQSPGSLAGDFGVRIASSVPSPGFVEVLIGALCALPSRSRRHHPFELLCLAGHSCINLGATSRDTRVVLHA